MNTIFILDNEKLGTWYVGKIYTKVNIDGFPIYRTLTQDQLSDNLYKKYIDYENPYINLIFLNETYYTCHGIERWMTKPKRTKYIQTLKRTGINILHMTLKNL